VGEGSVSGFGKGGLLLFGDGGRCMSSRVARLREGVRKGVKPGCSLIDVLMGGVLNGYSVRSECCPEVGRNGV
jgi:hypothetical protein